MGRRRKARQDGTGSPTRKRRRPAAASSYAPLVALESTEDEVKPKKRASNRRIRVKNGHENNAEIAEDPILSSGLTTPRPPKSKQISLSLSRGRKTKPNVSVSRRFSFSESPNLDVPQGKLYKHPPLLAPTIEDGVQSAEELPNNDAPQSCEVGEIFVTPKVRVSSPKRTRSRTRTRQAVSPPPRVETPCNVQTPSDSRGSCDQKRGQATVTGHPAPPQFSVDISPDSAIGHGVLAAHPPLIALTLNSNAPSEKRSVEKVPFPESQVDVEDNVDEPDGNYDVPETPVSSERARVESRLPDSGELEPAPHPYPSASHESAPLAQETEKQKAPIQRNEGEMLPSPYPAEDIPSFCEPKELSVPSQRRISIVPETPVQPQTIEPNNAPIKQDEITKTPILRATVIPETPSQSQETQKKDTPLQIPKAEVTHQRRVSFVPETPAPGEDNENDRHEVKRTLRRRRRVSFVPETPLQAGDDYESPTALPQVRSSTPKTDNVCTAKEVDGTQEPDGKRRRLSLSSFSSQLDYGAGATVTPEPPPRFVKVPGFPQSEVATETQSTGEYISATPPVVTNMSVAATTTPSAAATGYSTTRRRHPESNPYGRGKVVVPETPESPQDERCLFALRLMQGRLREPQACTPTPDSACRKALQLMRARADRAARPTVYDIDECMVEDWGTRVQFSSSKSPRVTPIGYRDDVPAGLLAQDEEDGKESD